MTSEAAETHQLNSKWCLWHCPNLAGVGIEKQKDLTRNVDSFDTVEAFWAVVAALPPATKLPLADVVMFFRETMEPAWEDPNFKTGGRIKIKLDPAPTAQHFIVSVLTHVIGETVSKEICPNIVGGVRVVRRERNKDAFIMLELWFTDKNKKDELIAYMINLAKDERITNLTDAGNVTHDLF
jgi:translation initiation factor 4E